MTSPSLLLSYCAYGDRSAFRLSNLPANVPQFTRPPATTLNVGVRESMYKDMERERETGIHACTHVNHSISIMHCEHFLSSCEFSLYFLFYSSFTFPIHVFLLWNSWLNSSRNFFFFVKESLHIRKAFVLENADNMTKKCVFCSKLN